MSMIPATFWFYAILSVLFTVFLILFHRRARDRNIYEKPFTRFFLVVDLSLIILVIQDFLEIVEINFPIGTFSLLGMSASMILIYVFFAQMRALDHHSSLYFCLWAMTMLYLVIEVLGLILGEEDFLEYHIFWIFLAGTTLYTLQGIIVFGVASLRVTQVYRFSQDRRYIPVILGLLLVTVSYSMYFISYTFYWVQDFSAPDQVLLGLITFLQQGGDGIRAGGLIFFFVSFTLAPELVHGIGQDIYSIAFFTPYGINVYFRNVRNRQAVVCSIDLFAAALSAIFSIIREGTGLGGRVQRLEMGSYDIIFTTASPERTHPSRANTPENDSDFKSQNSLPSKKVPETITCAVICEQATRTIQNCMDRTLQEFVETFAEPLTDDVHNRRAFLGTGEIISKYFPYLQLIPEEDE